MHAMRVARGYTGSQKIVSSRASYHGVHDYALISVTRTTCPSSATGQSVGWSGDGASRSRWRRPDPARFNRIDVLRRIFERDGGDIAAVIVEPIPRQRPRRCLPREGFHQEMRAHEEIRGLADLDEVKTGSGSPRAAPRVLRRHAGPRDVREGDRQRLSGRVLRRLRRGQSVLPDKVSHGGTKRATASPPPRRGDLEDLRDTNALASIHQVGREVQAACPRSSRSAAAVRVHRPTGDVRDHVTEQAPTEYRDWANSDHDLYARSRWACTPAARCRAGFARDVVLREAHTREDVVDRIVSISRIRSTRPSRPAPTTSCHASRRQRWAPISLGGRLAPHAGLVTLQACPSSTSPSSATCSKVRAPIVLTSSWRSCWCARRACSCTES